MTVFVKKNTIFKQKLLFFKILHLTVFAVSWSIFELFLPISPFRNYQSLLHMQIPKNQLRIVGEDNSKNTHIYGQIYIIIWYVTRASQYSILCSSLFRYGQNVIDLQYSLTSKALPSPKEGKVCIVSSRKIPIFHYQDGHHVN